MKNPILLSFVSFVSFVVAAFSSTNLTPASSALVSVNATTLQFRATGILESNAIARVNQPVTIADLTFTTNTWWESATNVWTNATGWTVSGTMTNGAIDCYTNALVSPLITGPGLRAVSVTWSNLYLLSELVEWSTNDTTWTEFEDKTDLTYTWPQYRLRIRAEYSTPPPGESPRAHLAAVTVQGHRNPDLIGQTNDHAGIVIRVDNPVGNRDAVNLQTLNTRLAGFVGGGGGSQWSSYPALSAVDLSGQSLAFDTRFLASVTNDTWSLTFAGAPLVEIFAGGSLIPHIRYFSLSGTSCTLRVTGAVGWRPYPEWTTDLLVGSWTRLTTNEFTSTYPILSNGQYTLTFPLVTNSPAYYRATAVDETGGTNGSLMTVHGGLDVESLTVNGVPITPGEAIVSNALYATTSGYATSAGSAGTAGYATSAGSAGTAGSASTSSYATNAGVASVAIYASSAGSATTADTATTANYAPTAGSAGTSATSSQALYAVSAGYAASAGSATSAGMASNGWIRGASRPFGTSAEKSTNDFAPGEWLVSIIPQTNLVITATNGANYNGPAVGTSFFLSTDIYPGYGIGAGNWCTTNTIGNPHLVVETWGTNGEWHLTSAYAPLMCFYGPTLTGTYYGTNFHAGAESTGTFTMATSIIPITNRTPYLSNGTGTFACITGPATNQFAPPISALVRWSGVWTNIQDSITNLLQFYDGYATNRVTL